MDSAYIKLERGDRVIVSHATGRETTLDILEVGPKQVRYIKTDSVRPERVSHEQFNDWLTSLSGLGATYTHQRDGYEVERDA